jgi:uncharacterized lipoprotein YmbA
MRRRAGLAGLIMVAACSASPTPELFTLAAKPGPTTKIAARSVGVRRVALAGYLDRPEIVRSDSEYRIHLTSNQRWGEPLGGMFDRVLTEELVQRLPGTAVFSESGAISTTPDFVVEVDVQRFDLDTSGMVVLLAQVAVRPGDSHEHANARTLRFTAKPASPATRDYVAAMSAALGEFADAVSGMLAQAAAAARPRS